MKREVYLDMAKGGLRMPVGADLVLHAAGEAEAILKDAKRLGKVYEDTARRFHTPLAIPNMDLTIEKHWMLSHLGVDEKEISQFHFKSTPAGAQVDQLTQGLKKPLNATMQARSEAITYVAGLKDIIPVGMTIGPFSFMTKLLADPISAVFMAGSGMTAEDEPEVGTVERLMEMCVEVILASMKSQADAGAKAILVAEPAANLVYIFPKQLSAGDDIFDRLVMRHNLRLKEYLDSRGVDLIFHDCGELDGKMLVKIAKLHPVILSLGSSRVLWEDAKIVPKDIVLFGNLPSKKFYSEQAMPLAEVEKQACNLLSKMKLAGHPYILGTECDVLHVPGAAEIINRKVDAFMNVKC